MNFDRKLPGFLFAVLFVAMIFILQLMVVIPVLIIEAFTKFPLTKHMGVIGFINIVTFSFTLFIGILLLKKPVKSLLPLRKTPWAVYVPLTLCSLGLHIIASEINNLMHKIVSFPYNDLLTNGIKTSFWGTVITLIIIAPITEELFFRGLILRGTLASFRFRWAIFISSFLFAVLHGNLDQIPGAFLIGLVLGLVVFRLNSLLPALYVHALSNALCLLGMFLPFTIPGYNAEGPVTLQPMGLDIAGILLTSLGLWWFMQMKNADTPQASPTSSIAEPM